MKALLLVVLAFATSSTDSVPLAPKRAAPAATVSIEHPFDLGSVTSCAKAPASSACPSVDYSIPSVIANSLEVRVAAVGNVVTYLNAFLRAGDDRGCIEDVRNEFCQFHLPRCTEEQDGTNTIDIAFNCSQALARCPKNRGSLNWLCPNVSQQIGTYRLEQCSPPSEEQPIDASSISDCAKYSDPSLPSWIGAYLSIAEVELRANYELIRSRSVSSEVLQGCIMDWFNVSCQSFGRCWAQGDRLERLHSKHQCQLLRTCTDDSETYSNIVFKTECESLPTENSRLTTDPTPYTVTTTTPNRTSVSTSSTSTNVQTTVIVISASSTHSAPSLTSMLLAVLLAIACLLYFL